MASALRQSKLTDHGCFFLTTALGLFFLTVNLNAQNDTPLSAGGAPDKLAQEGKDQMLRQKIIKVLLESENPREDKVNSDLVWKLALLATSGLAFMWIVFWTFVYLRKENVTDILLSPAFFKTVCVMGVIAATVVLSLSGTLEANLTGAILSGVVGYVLGTITGRKKHDNEKDTAGS